MRILSTIDRELLKPSASVALHKHSNALVDVLPPEADSSITMLQAGTFLSILHGRRFTEVTLINNIWREIQMAFAGQLSIGFVFSSDGVIETALEITWGSVPL